MTSFTGIRPFYVAGIAFLFLIQLALIFAGMPGSLAGRADFRQLYTAGYMLRTGHGNQLYDYRTTIAYEQHLAGTIGASLPFNHPAYEALLYVPLSLLSYRQAFYVFFLLNVLILFAAVRLLSPPAAWILSLWSRLPIGLFVGFLPVGVCLIQGQDSIIILGLLTGSYVLAERGRDGAAGALLALSLFKFQFIVPIVLFLFLATQRKWKLLAGFFITTLALVTASLLIAGFDSLHTYPRYLASMSAGLASEAQRQTYGIYPEKMPNLRGLFYLLFGSWFPFSTLQAVTAASSAVFFLWSVRRKLPFELAVVAGFLVGYHCMIHDAVILLLPLLKAVPRAGVPIHGPLSAWSLLAVSPTLAFLLDLPYSLVGISVLLFLASM